jgi:hypothetical protein
MSEIFGSKVMVKDNKNNTKTIAQNKQTWKPDSNFSKTLIFFDFKANMNMALENPWVYFLSIAMKFFKVNSLVNIFNGPPVRCSNPILFLWIIL